MHAMWIHRFCLVCRECQVEMQQSSLNHREDRERLLRLVERYVSSRTRKVACLSLNVHTRVNTRSYIHVQIEHDIKVASD